MAKQGTAARARARKDRVVATRQLAAPPAGEGKEDLSVEIGVSVGWRIKVALFSLEQEGRKTTKKAFIEELIVDGLDRFDQEREKANRRAA